MAHAQCETCGNIYDKAFHVSLDGQTHVFDSFECAIEALAPRCTHCHCRVIGHGVERAGDIFCCRHCADATDVMPMTDRNGARATGRVST
ncbi:MAG TPA: hypothetical protein VN903_08850 [Polyangia bacterium]|jgi:hypothetical protein|nr:hypothetical protein [Polyangia bacterium]